MTGVVVVTVTGTVAVTVCGVVSVVLVADAVAVRLNVVEVSEAGTVTSTVAPVVSEGSLTIVTDGSEAVQVQFEVVTAEPSDAVTVPRNTPVPPCAMLMMFSPYEMILLQES